MARSVVVGVSFLGILLTGAGAYADQFDPVRARIRTVMTFCGIPSVTVGVAQKGNIIWEEGFGFADVEKRVPATAHTPYLLASISKPITPPAYPRTFVTANSGEALPDRLGNAVSYWWTLGAPTHSQRLDVSQ